MKETANSKPVNATNIEKGINVKIANIKLLLNIWYKKVENIFIREWPATRLANNRTPNDTALAK
jgi:hypothetical protein